MERSIVAEARVRPEPAHLGAPAVAWGSSTLSRTAVSHHLRVLREAGVLQREKVGKEVYFWPDADSVRTALDAVRDYLAAHY